MRYFLFPVIMVVFSTCQFRNNEACIPCGKPEDVFRLTSQGDVNTFREKLPPGCTSVRGAVSISGMEIQDLTPLDFLKGVGNLSVQQVRGLSFLRGFPNLDSVYRELTIELSEFEEIDAFHRLTYTGSGLNIRSLPNLKLIKGFDRLRSCKNLVISYNPELIELPVFPRLTKIRQSLILVENNKVQIIKGFTSLDTVSDLVQIERNRALTSISGFHQLKHEANLLIVNNLQLRELSGFSSLRKGHTISVKNNPVLKEIGAFQNLERVTRYGLFILDNPSLKSVRGLAKLKQVNSRLEIKNNPELAGCCFFFTALTDAPSSMTFDISGNKTGCNSKDEIIQQGVCK